MANSEYQSINSSTFQHSVLDSRAQEKKVLKSQVDSILENVDKKNTKTIALLDQTLAQNIKSELNTLSRENSELTKELNDLMYYKYSLLMQQIYY